jgi:hypothetical protein
MDEERAAAPFTLIVVSLSLRQPEKQTRGTTWFTDPGSLPIEEQIWTIYARGGLSNDEKASAREIALGGASATWFDGGVDTAWGRVETLRARNLETLPIQDGQPAQEPPWESRRKQNAWIKKAGEALWRRLADAGFADARWPMLETRVSFAASLRLSGKDLAGPTLHERCAQWEAERLGEAIGSQENGATAGNTTPKPKRRPLSV